MQRSALVRTGRCAMTRNSKSVEVTSSIARSNAVRSAVQTALRLGTGVVTAGLALGMGQIASAEPFPPVFPLSRLLPANGGDGTQGYVLAGIGVYDRSGR